MRKKSYSFKRRNAVNGLIFISPWLIGFLVFFAYPVITNFRLSLSRMVTLRGYVLEYIGFDGYNEVLLVQLKYTEALTQLAREIAISTPIIVVAAICFSLMLNKDIKGKGFWRLIFILPILLGTGHAMRQLVGMAVNIDGGSSSSLTFILPREVAVYIGPQMSNAITTFLSQVNTILWKSSVQTIIMLGAIQSVPASMYESAKCDGATEWEMFWKISMPVVSPFIVLISIYTIIEASLDSNNPVLEYISSIDFGGSVPLRVYAALGNIMILLVLFFCMLIYVPYAIRNKRMKKQGN